ncbi:MAG: hypothetical protein RL189_1709 [Pseudomonadota bacterium]|jgi:hypothetical protein
MWFVWDGRTRIGPMSEQEICRRVAGGEWPLVVYVRPESSAVYRPLLWMLPKWTSNTKEIEHTVIRGQEPMHEVTQIASSAYLENAAFRNSSVTGPVQLAQAVAAEIPAPPAAQLPSMAESILAPPAAIPQPPPDWGTTRAGKKSEQNSSEPQFAPARAKKVVDDMSEKDISFADLEPLAAFSQTPATPVSLQPRMRDSAVEDSRSENSVIRAATAAIVEGERQTREFEKRKVSGGADVDEIPGAVQVAQRSKDLHLSVQSPAHASEGMVSLADNDSATQIKFRRLNPTAPRKRGRTSGRRTMDKGPANSLRKFLTNNRSEASVWKSPLTIGVISFAVIMIVFVGVVIFDKRQQLNELREQNSQQVAESRQTQSSTPSGQNDSQDSATGTRKKKKKKLNARPLDGGGAKSNANRPKVFENTAELSRYLLSPGARGFIVVGPVKLQKPASGGCSPCRISGKFSDGSAINLVSLVDQPWQEVAGSTVVYARGFLTENEKGRLILTVNKLSQKPF